nr:lamin tail domain-containing protein [Burkholderiales bacterium]
TLTGYRHGGGFGAAANGVSVGRHVNSAGDEQWPAQLTRTTGAANSGPRVGPAVLSEVFYHPPTGGVEFIEVVNITAAPLALFDPAFPTNTWRIGGASFAFPTNVTLSPGGIAVVAATNEAVFRALYSVPTNALVFGPLTGALQDSGERLSLERPDAPQTNGIVPYIVVDDVRYNDKAPWPASPDGAGDSLQRLAPDAYGNEPLNWTAAAPTPGALPSANPDRDGDGMPNDWEMVNGLDPDNADDAALDSDSDGLTNLQEYLAGTDPQSAASSLRVVITSDTAGARLTFTAIAGRSYAVQAQASLGVGAWSNIFTLPAPSFTQLVEWTDTNALNQRFYRLVTPNPNP